MRLGSVVSYRSFMFFDIAESFLGTCKMFTFHQYVFQRVCMASHIVGYSHDKSKFFLLPNSRYYFCLTATTSLPGE